MEQTTYYKVLGQGGVARMGVGYWHLPVGNRPGKWMDHIEHLLPCHSGYHVCTLDMLPKWVGPEIYEVEVRGESVVNPDKLVVQQARLLRRLTAWDSKTARLFAADCAEHVLKLYPWDDTHLRRCIATVRAFAHGQSDDNALRGVSYNAHRARVRNEFNGDVRYAVEAAVAETAVAWAFSAAQQTVSAAIYATREVFGARKYYDFSKYKHTTDDPDHKQVAIYNEMQWQAARLKSYLEIGDD